MDRKEKLGTFHLLLDDKFQEADYALLKKEDPKNKIFARPMNPALCREALLELLDIVDKKDIIKYRAGYQKVRDKELAVARKAEQLSQKERLLDKLKEGKLKEVREAVDSLPDDHLFVDDLEKVLKEEEDAAAEKAAEQKEIVLKKLEEGDIAEAEAMLLELPEDFIFLTELAEAINDAKIAAKNIEDKEAEKALEEATAEKESIEMLLEEENIEEAKTAIDGLAQDHPFKKELEAAHDTALTQKESTTDEGGFPADPELGDTYTKDEVEYEFTEKGWVELTLTDEDESGSQGADTEVTPAGVSAKKKPAQVKSSKKSGSTQGSGGTS